ncbi:26S proteasome regulatory complex, non-ATPase subcomplex, Rpn1 subunit, partial [Caulochytrium protostelioides]
SEEDQQLKSELELLVERLKNGSNPALHKPSLESLRTLIRTSTSSMTSVPKPLKFLRSHYPSLIALYNTWPESRAEKKPFADILSVLAMSYAGDDKRESLNYRLRGAGESPGLWGHEYVRHLASEIIDEYDARINAALAANPEAPIDKKALQADMMPLAMELVPFFLQHNAEADACDLLLELEALENLIPLVTKETAARICLYIVSCVSYVAPPDDMAILQTAHAIYRSQNQMPQALQVALRMNHIGLVREDFEACEDPVLKRQLAYMLARQGVPVDTDDETLTEILSQSHLHQHFASLARDLDVVEPKHPDDVYKRHLENLGPRGGMGGHVDSARQNLASTYVNAFVNAGFGSDKLMLPEDSQWIYKNKEHGMMAATASLGALHLWNVEMGLSAIDKYLYSEDEHIKAGALFAIGMVTANVRNESDPALALLQDYVTDAKPSLRVAAVAAMGIAYAGTARQEVLDLLLPLVSDTAVDMEVASLAALSLGMVYVGRVNGDIIDAILQTLMERDAAALAHVFAPFMGAGLAYLFLGKGEAVDATLETLKTVESALARQIAVLAETMAYMGTGNVLKVQKMLSLCTDHLDGEKQDDQFQAMAVLGIALIASGEDIGTEMALRSFNHLMHYGEPVIRRAVPLATAFLYASNPQVHVVEVLSKHSHDNDPEVSMNAIVAMGIVGAGTNNARLAQMMRQLAAYYHKEPNHLFLVRIGQGLIHAGKGTLTLNPWHAHRMLVSPTALVGLVTTLLAFTDAKALILGRAHYFLYHLVTALYPRFLVTLDADLQPLPATVRVGTAVE